MCSWLTVEQLSERYQLSVRMVFYLVADAILPAFKVGHALRFDPAECDLAMRAFRRASKFDRFIEEELEKDKATQCLEAELQVAGKKEEEFKPGRLRRRLGPKRPKPGDPGDFHGERERRAVGKAQKKQPPQRKSRPGSASPRIPVFLAELPHFRLKTARN
jgi:hypothetical protein